ncbi:DNA sulfur modification protein DndB [Mycobacteroides abscessus]|uniref:DNA sulfur modification protein DndB n=1 Tax=Mycobacteroides abscessus TaxID=36809 RepID=UPI000C25A306|nr:DNA sulfur modification protein DndB [Mycobacteroides abscessus]RIU26225.1 hypothetical protein D2E89_00805 [Mycobacteroides abscessus]
MTQSNPAVDVYDLDAMEQKKTEFLRQVLAQRLTGDSVFLVQRARMGHVDTYVGRATFKWIANEIRLFTQLPILKSKINAKGQFEIDEQSVQDLQQRAPNWSRQQILTMYLFRQPRRKFPPILVVVQESWVNDPSSEEWDSEGRAKRTSLPMVTNLTEDGSVAIMDFGQPGVTVYVIDGSHRFIGIKGLSELIKSGKLMTKKPDGTEGNTSQDIDDLMEKFDVRQADLDGIMDESIGIEFIPAVVKGETATEARRRVRSVFVHVNKTAQPPTKGEVAILDEDNGFAIVARAIVFNHKLFKKDEPGDRINWKTNALPRNSKWLTSSVTVIEMVKDYLSRKPEYAKWKPDSAKEIPFRPIEDELEGGESDISKFFDKVAALPVFHKVATGTPIDKLREFPSDGEGHLLMRPIGQQILADAVGYLVNAPSGPRMELDAVFKRLAVYDKKGGFSNVTTPGSVWYGLTYNPFRKTMATDRKVQSALLLRHLLHEPLGEEDRDALVKALNEVREVQDKDKVWDWDGKTEVDRVGLPVQIS